MIGRAFQSWILTLTGFLAAIGVMARWAMSWQITALSIQHKKTQSRATMKSKVGGWRSQRG